MKRKLNKIIAIFLCLFTFQLTTYRVVHATADSIIKDGGIFKEDAPSDSRLKEVWETHQLDKSSIPFELQGILSGKAAIAKQELKEDYIQLFYNTTKMLFLNEKTAAKFLGIPIPFSDTFDLKYHATNLISNIIEVLEKLFSWFSIFAMMLYARASDNFFGIIVEQLFQFTNKNILGINQFNGIAVKMMLAFAAVSLLSLVVQRTARGKGVSPKALIYQVISYIINVALVFFILNYGPGIINSAQTAVDDFFTQSVLNDSVPLEIVTKRELFDLLQKTPFFFRHFGVVEDTNISTTKNKEELTAICYQNMEKSIHSNNETNSDSKALLEMAKIKCSEQASKSLNEREKISIHAFFKDPIESTLVSIQNTGLYSVPTKENAPGKLSDSFIFGVFRFILGGVVLFVCAIYLVTGILYHSTLYLSCYSLVFAVKNPDKQSMDWFLQRLSWMVFYSIIGFIFSILILILLKASKVLMTINLLFLFVFDAFLVFMLFTIIKNPTILMNIFKKIWSTFVDGALHGKITPKDALIDAKDMIVNGANATFEKAFGSNKEDEVSQNVEALESTNHTVIRDDLKEVHTRLSDDALSEYYKQLGIDGNDANRLKEMSISSEQQKILNENPEQLNTGEYRIHSRTNNFIPKNQLEAAETIAYLYGKINVIPDVERRQETPVAAKNNNATDIIQETTEIKETQSTIHQLNTQETIEKEIQKETAVNETYSESIIEQNSHQLINLDIEKELNLTNTLRQLNQAYTTQNWKGNEQEQKLLQALIQATRTLYKNTPSHHISIQQFMEYTKEKGMDTQIVEKYVSTIELMKETKNENI